MATTLVTLAGNVRDMLDGTFDTRRTKVYLRHNTEYVVDPDAGVIRLGSATVTPNDDGSFELADVIAAVDTVENLQATVYVDYADPSTRTRKTQPFGPYDLSAETGTVDIATDLEPVQHLDPSFASETMAQMQALLDAQIEISTIDDTDSGVAGVMGSSLIGPLTRAATRGLISGDLADNASSIALAADARVDSRIVRLAGDYSGATDGAKIVAAIAAASAAGGGIVRINRRPLTTVWDLGATTAIAVPSNITIEAEPGVTLNVSGAITNVAVFTAAGTEGTKTALTANAAAGSLSAALPTGQGANFSPGDLIAFEADVAIFGATNGRPREIQRIVKITTDTVYFSTPLLDSYNTADSATFSKVTPVKNITFRGLRFTNSNPTTNTGYVMRFQLCEGIRVQDFVFTDMGGAIELRDCIDSDISDGTIDRLRNYGSSYGYGIDLVGACSSINVDRIRGRSMRHLFTTLGLDRSGVFWGYPKHVIVSDCIGTGDVDSLSIFDTHEAGRDITYNNCVAIGGGTSCNGFQVRAKNVKLNNCTADRNGARGLSTTLDATGLRVNGGRYTRAGSNGMSLQANDIQVFGAEVAKSGNAGIVVLTGLTGIIVKGCIITDSGDAGSSGYGIHDQGATGAVYDTNLIPKSTTQTVSILSLRATSVATNNVLMGYGSFSWGFSSADAAAIRMANHGDSGTEFSGVVRANGMFQHLGTTLGVYGTTPTTKRTVSGSRGSNAALQSLLTALAAYGIITDSSS